jgi:hypothetical protein
MKYVISVSNTFSEFPPHDRDLALPLEADLMVKTARLVRRRRRVVVQLHVLEPRLGPLQGSKYRVAQNKRDGCVRLICLGFLHGLTPIGSQKPFQNGFEFFHIF